MDPRLAAATLRQPDATTCGAAVLVMARSISDPGYAELLATGLHPLTGYRLPGAIQERFAAEALAMHRRTTSSVDVRGAAQLPWPQKYGTPPWAVARQLSGTVGADGTRATYSWHVARTSLPGAYQRLLDATRAGRVSAIYVGTTWVPRHVALVVEATATGTLNVYDPARGRLDELDRLAFLGNRVDIAGWDVAWFVVTPDS